MRCQENMLKEIYKDEIKAGVRNEGLSLVCQISQQLIERLSLLCGELLLDALNKSPPGLHEFVPDFLEPLAGLQLIGKLLAAVKFALNYRS